MKTNKNIFKNIAIAIVTLLLFNCSDEIQEDNSIIEELNLQEDGLSTVPLDNTFDFFNTLNTSNKLNKSSTDKNNIDLKIDLESLKQVDITNTDAKLNIANATTKFDNVETQVLQIEIDGEIQTVLFHHIPENNADSADTNNIATTSSFTGSVFSTDLSGIVLSGFDISNGNILGTFNFSTTSYSTDPEPCWGITCGITLNEVVITSNASSTSNWAYSNYANTTNVMMNYQFVRSTNNYSSMGTAYANYYIQKAVEEFVKENVWDKQDPYDKWNKLTECEKTFFKTNPEFLWNAQSNRARAENAAKKIFPNCDLHNDVGDAFRHSYFAALNTQNMGYLNAKNLGDAHECDTPTNLLNEKTMDLHNNSWGYNYAGTNSYFTEQQFLETFMNSYNNNEIQVLENCN